MGTEVVLFLLILWGVVTLIGHGTWVVLAKIFGAGKAAAPPARRSVAEGECPRCGCRLEPIHRECHACGWPRQQGVRNNPQEALRALRQKLTQLLESEAIDIESVTAIRAAITTQEERLATLAAEAAKAKQGLHAGARPGVAAAADGGIQADALAEPVASVNQPLTAPIEPPPVTSHESPVTSASDRVREYALRRMAAMESAGAEPAAVAPPPKKREALSRLFAAFMQEKNIRWGELVGGLLIVGCSVALVISFWSEIAANAMLKFGLLGGVTSALFGVGLYTDRKWKIPTTSHGILVIGSLLVPLNFLAIAAFTQGEAASNVVTIAGEAVSAIVFAALLYLAGKVIAPGNPGVFAAGVLIPSLMQLAIRRFAFADTPLTTLYVLAAVPVFAYVLGTAWVVGRGRNDGEFQESQAFRLLTFLGVTSAATFFPLALLTWRGTTVEEALHQLSPLAVWCGVPALVVGLVFWRRMTRKDMTAVQTAGLAVGVLGAAIMAGAAVAAWPDPATLLPVAAMNFVALTLVAFWFGIPTAHLPAGLALVAIWLISIYLKQGTIGWTLDDDQPLSRALVSAMSGRMLVPLVGVFGVAAWLLRTSGRREDAKMYGLVGAATAVASLALVLWFGFARAGDPQNIVWTLGIYAIATLVVAWLIDRPGVVWVGPVLVLLTIWQAVAERWPVQVGYELPRVTALLAFASLLIVGAAALVWFRLGRVHLGTALRFAAALASIAAAGLLVVSMLHASTAALAIYVAWLAAVWLGLALLTGWAWIFSLSQLATVAAIFIGVTAAVEGREWYAAARFAWLDPWFVVAQGSALAVFTAVVGGIRWYFRRIADTRNEEVIEPPAPTWYAIGDRLLNAPWPAVDRVVRAGVVIAFVAMAIYAVWPGVGQELAPLEAARGTAPAVRVVTPVAAYQIAGIDQTHAAGNGAWLFGAAVLGAVCIGMGERRQANAWLLAAIIVLAMVCPLLAARWEAEVATASALRWISAVFFLVASTALWIARRGGVGAVPGIDKLRWTTVRNLLVTLVVLVYAAMGCYVASRGIWLAGTSRAIEELIPWVFGWTVIAGAAGLALPALFRGQESLQLPLTGLRNALLLVALAPLATIGAFAVAAALDQHPIVGPDPASWFRRIGWDVTYGVPLALIALSLVGHAIRDRSSGFAFSAGLLANVVATIVVLMRVARGAGLDTAAWITVAQMNAIVAGVVSLAWLAAVRWSRSREPVLLVTQVALAAVLCGMFLVPAAVQLVGEPAGGNAWVAQAGDWLGWISLLLSMTAAAGLSWNGPVRQPIVAYFIALLIAIVAVTSLRWDTGNWLAFHVLLAGLVLGAWCVPLLTSTFQRIIGGVLGSATVIRWSAASARVLGIAAILIALRALDNDPQRPWWTIAVFAVLAWRNLWIAWHEGGRRSTWIAAALTNSAASVWWLTVGHLLTGTRDVGQLLELTWINIIAAAGIALASGAIEFFSTSREEPPRRGLGYHRFAAWTIVAALAATTAAGLIGDLYDATSEAYPILAWAAWWAAVAAAVACWWDARSRWRVACLYAVGLLAVGIYLDNLNLRTPLLEWAGALALAAYSLVTSLLWNRRSEIGATLASLAVPGAPESTRSHSWLVAANGLSAFVVLALVAWMETTMPEFRHRMIAAYAVGAEALALALLARGAVQSPLQYLSLVFGTLFAVAFGWSWLSPEMPAPWLHRIVVAIVALAVSMIVYGFGFAKVLRRESEWTRAAERLVPALAAIAALLLAGVLAIEVLAFANQEPAPISWPALVAVAATLVGLAAAALVAALVPGRDPLGLSERGRTVYVYAAEVLLALTFVHIRVTMPELFSGWFAQFWPLIVMVIAFVGVGVGEFFQRRKTQVLASPLTNTGALLPVLPALGFWIKSVPESSVHYSLLLLTVGVLYAGVGVLRKSFWFGVLAALAANGSLWYLLYSREGLAITEHPQLWLIPPALCVLAAGFINRQRLSTEQSAAIRYGAAIVIYASSTADIFINGVADAPWLPVVLAGFSILGVFAGILLQIRAFLYLGVTFLTVAIMTVIWYAAIEQERTWILWVAGIVTGVAIIALFGVFEKRRDDVLRVVDRLKHWEA